MVSQSEPCACITSRIPPWSMMTAKAMSAPTTNHHRKILTVAMSEINTALERAVLNGFRDMGGRNLLRASMIRNRPDNS